MFDFSGKTVLITGASYGLGEQFAYAFAEAGGEGLEVVSGSHSRDDYFRMARHAQDFGLLASAGSDYHGPEQAWVELGHLPELPDGCVPIWQDWPKHLPN